MTGGRDSWLQLAEKYAVNAPMRLLSQLGLARHSFAQLETVGRRTGKRRLTPVGNGLEGETFWLVAERGSARWVREEPARRPPGTSKGGPALVSGYRTSRPRRRPVEEASRHRPS